MLTACCGLDEKQGEGWAEAAVGLMDPDGEQYDMQGMVNYLLHRDDVRDDARSFFFFFEGFR